MKLNLRLWAEIMAIATYIWNEIPTKTISKMTLKKVWCEYKSPYVVCVFLVLKGL
jgi:hypothetical protein